MMVIPTWRLIWFLCWVCHASQSFQNPVFREYALNHNKDPYVIQGRVLNEGPLEALGARATVKDARMPGACKGSLLGIG